MPGPVGGGLTESEGGAVVAGADCSVVTAATGADGTAWVTVAAWAVLSLAVGWLAGVPEDEPPGGV